MTGTADKTRLERAAAAHRRLLDKMKELARRQGDLLRRVISRIDAEQADEVRKRIDEDTNR